MKTYLNCTHEGNPLGGKLEFGFCKYCRHENTSSSNYMTPQPNGLYCNTFEPSKRAIKNYVKQEMIRNNL